jgi:hypothetical protein
MFDNSLTLYELVFGEKLIVGFLVIPTPVFREMNEASFLIMDSAAEMASAQCRAY